MAATVHGSQIQLWWRKKEREKESAASTCMKNTVQASETVVCVSDKVGSTNLREYPCGKKEKSEGMREGKTQTNEQKSQEK